MGQKIETIEIHHYRLPLDPPLKASWGPQPRTSHTSTIVRVRAGDYEGVGSGDAMLGFRGHESLFIGQDPFNIERHVRLLDNLQFHYGRIWPLEVALWDLMGKISGQPLWKLHLWNFRSTHLPGGPSAAIFSCRSQSCRIARAILPYPARPVWG